MSAKSSPEKTTAQPLQPQMQEHQQQRHIADSTYGSDEEILTKLKNLGIEDTLSLSLLAKFKELTIERRYFSPPPTASSTVEERLAAWNAEYCGYWSPSYDDRIPPYCRPLPSTIPPGTESPSRRPTGPYVPTGWAASWSWPS
ncbi:hypothetical protein N0V84_008213 [Fusarium piperis]|uniref:Uncharacterized protein n=1 Tax=Fusarium piperis TaxID=1435070 RepID=A0A9W8W8G4_9HYPO|nr:hypothetical protein N0V84_008213 [Fusarium piperis]